MIRKTDAITINNLLDIKELAKPFSSDLSQLVLALIHAASVPASIAIGSFVPADRMYSAISFKIGMRRSGVGMGFAAVAGSTFAAMSVRPSAFIVQPTEKNNVKSMLAGDRMT